MTEVEWLTATEPGPMLEFLRGKASDRKMRLLLAGCARLVWDMIPPGDQREAVLVAERYADGNATLEELRSVRSQYYAMPNNLLVKDRHSFLLYCLAYAASVSPQLISRSQSSTNWVGVVGITGQRLPDLIRCVFGNPFRPVMLDPSWLTTKASAMARGIYADRAFDRLPILADALQDAGCDHADVLAHCRSDGPHVRGCWVVDLVLGLS